MVRQSRLEQIESPEFLDSLYAILADSTRRSLLRYLTSHPKPVTIDRLASELAAIEHGIPVETVTSDQRREIALRLQHVDVPALDDAGVVSWSRETQQIEHTPLWETVQTTMPALGELLESSLIDPSGATGKDAS
ncbi:DUF7344 domain-containing protein [Natrinema caseinilyticum]|uniref:DUF7344 domain-containing protein n=1 Tax=Natrinema caseinilyticum TaxID=2961570 RepID=UPI0020C2D2B2|nr:hypothetical protein [Natrinema caseinilyticum]